MIAEDGTQSINHDDIVGHR